MDRALLDKIAKSLMGGQLSTVGSSGGPGPMPQGVTKEPGAAGKALQAFAGAAQQGASQALGPPDIGSELRMLEMQQPPKVEGVPGIPHAPGDIQIGDFVRKAIQKKKLIGLGNGGGGWEDEEIIP